MNEYDKARKAEALVDQHTGFYIHLAAYVVVNALLIAINMRDDEDMWAHIPLIAWGIGLLFHAFGVFGVKTWFANQRLRRIHRTTRQL